MTSLYNSIDLETMEKKMEARKYYLNKESFTKDLQLIFENAKALR